MSAGKDYQLAAHEPHVSGKDGTDTSNDRHRRYTGTIGKVKSALTSGLLGSPLCFALLLAKYGLSSLTSWRRAFPELLCGVHMI